MNRREFIGKIKLLGFVPFLPVLGKEKAPVEEFHLPEPEYPDSAYMALVIRDGNETKKYLKGVKYITVPKKRSKLIERLGFSMYRTIQVKGKDI